MERQYFNYRHSRKAWELLHEEAGFEDLGVAADRMLTDFDGQETHLHFHEEMPREAIDKAR